MTVAELLNKLVGTPASEAMREASTLEQAFVHAFGQETGAAIAEAKHIETEIVEIAEKEIQMITDSANALLARIKAALARAADKSSADAQTISTLQGQVSDLQEQVAGLQQQILSGSSDVEAALADVANAADAVAPPPAG